MSGFKEKETRTAEKTKVIVSRTVGFIVHQKFQRSGTKQIGRFASPAP
jgi:hypothetical protein